MGTGSLHPVCAQGLNPGVHLLEVSREEISPCFEMGGSWTLLDPPQHGWQVLSPKL